MTAPERAGVIGWPVSHSRSPAIFTYWFQRYGVNGTYDRIAVSPEEFPRRLRGIAASGYQGVNVTVPHKEAAFRAVDRCTDRARRIGSVNLVTVLPGGLLLGDSADGYGFIESLRAQIPGWRPESGPAALIGAGGSALAIADVLLASGVGALRIINRTRARAEALAARFPGDHAVFDLQDADRGVADAALIVNTSTLGMEGQPELDLSLSQAQPAAAVSDIVYAPLETRLLAEARARGMPVADGIGMLLHQARPAFERWFGVSPRVDDALREAVLGAGDE